jgi:uncharacterized RDD family membrane protein YckC
VVLATIGQRFLARLLDLVIFGAMYVVLFVLGVGGLGASVDPQTGQASAAGAAALFGTIALAAVLGLLYEVVLIALKGQTVGKMALGIAVVRSADGGVPGWGPSTVRWLIPLVGAFVCYVGAILVYLSPLFDSSGRMQGWHDKAANTLVVSIR